MAVWWRNERGEAYVAAQVALMLLVAATPFVDPAALAGPPALYRVAGWIAGIAGAALALAGFASLGKNLTPLPRPKEGASLVVVGAYAFVRHPIYAGIAIASVGWALGWRSPLALLMAVILFVLLDAKSRREELWLVEAYPGYAEYRRRVKRLVPFVY